MSELQLEQQIPFSASLHLSSHTVKWMAIVPRWLNSAPDKRPRRCAGESEYRYHRFIDQFGRAQPVGGLNEKIEGFLLFASNVS